MFRQIIKIKTRGDKANFTDMLRYGGGVCVYFKNRTAIIYSFTQTKNFFDGVLKRWSSFGFIKGSNLKVIEEKSMSTTSYISDLLKAHIIGLELEQEEIHSQVEGHIEYAKKWELPPIKIEHGFIIHME